MKTCNHCGLAMTRTHRAARYCSTECKNSAADRRRRARVKEAQDPRECDRCKKVYQPATSESRFCSAICSKNARIEEDGPTYRPCKVCGEDVPMPKSYHPKCKAEHEAKRLKERNFAIPTVPTIHLTEQDAYFYSLVNTNTAIKRRPCLRCRSEFNSTAGNRLCGSCNAVVARIRS